MRRDRDADEDWRHTHDGATPPQGLPVEQARQRIVDPDQVELAIHRLRARIAGGAK